MTTVAIMMTIVPEMTLSTPTKVIRMTIKTTTKTTTKTKTMKLLECTDPRARTKGKQIGFLTMAH